MNLLPLLWTSQSEAHRPGLSYAKIDGDQLQLIFARPELLAIAPLGPTQADLEASRVLLMEGTLALTSVRAGGAACRYGELEIGMVEEDGISLTVPLDCPAGTARSYEASFWSRLEPGHRHYVEVAGEPVAVLDAQNAAVSFDGTPGAGEVAVEFLGLGVEHIWTGYDHLLFLAGLLLAAARLKDMLLIVTGFTAAHSITLSLAALGYVTLSPDVVEPAIAASILLVGIENFFRPPPLRRVALTFVLGLIHGFGFAGLLAELGLPRGNLALALVCFNGGVEIGQAAVVVLLLPTLLYLRRWAAWDRYIMPGGSALVALAGAWWLWERTLGG